MNDSLRKIVLLLWISIVRCHNFLNSAPVINATDLQESSDILYYQTGETLSRTCWSFYDSTWILPDNDVRTSIGPLQFDKLAFQEYRKEEDNPEKDGRLSIIENRTQNGWFKTKLILRDLRYTDTGFYTCKAKVSIFDDVSNYSGNEPQFSRIYVVVSSELRFFLLCPKVTERK